MSSDSLEEKMRELGLFPPTDSDGNIRYDPEASGLAALTQFGSTHNVDQNEIFSSRDRTNIDSMQS